ncbi:MAG: recombinase family protein, partial [Lachnospiraceae bacterium]|nr:recombinase family protein [Lachnospiraceae bacterium]
ADEMEIVKYCFHQYAYSPNISMNQICNTLTEKGYKSRRKNGGWDNVTIARMLQNSVYAVADERLKKYYEIRKIKFANVNIKM